ncbi:15057_t:CDS:1, partial [Racocetra persica]
ALLDELKEKNFEYDYQCDQDNHLTHLFFAYSTSIILTKAYSSVLLIDYTYKTNKFRMPLLHVVGMTSFNTTFSSCFAFLKSEQKEDYE